jgi:hydrogenase-4 component F
MSSLVGILAAGPFAITGSPVRVLPSEPILKAALDQGRAGVAIAYLTFLAVVFVGMATTMLGMAQGRPAERCMVPAKREPLLGVAPAAALAALALVLGVYVPPSLRAAIEQAVQLLG